MKAQSEFSAKVIGFIKKVPSGKVATYSQIARLSGKPHAARGVAWILHSCSESHDLPWHRILNSKGKISFPTRTENYKQQKRRLQKEGVRFSGDDEIDLSKFQWSKDAKAKKSAKRVPKMFG